MGLKRNKIMLNILSGGRITNPSSRQKARRFQPLQALCFGATLKRCRSFLRLSLAYLLLVKGVNEKNRIPRYFSSPPIVHTGSFWAMHVSQTPIRLYRLGIAIPRLHLWHLRPAPRSGVTLTLFFLSISSYLRSHPSARALL